MKRYIKEILGWDEEGVPTREKLEEFDLHDVAEVLEKEGIPSPKKKSKKNLA